MNFLSPQLSALPSVVSDSLVVPGPAEGSRVELLMGQPLPRGGALGGDAARLCSRAAVALAGVGKASAHGEQRAEYGQRPSRVMEE